MKKSILFLAGALVFSIISCKENTKGIITDQDMQKVAAEKEFLNKLPKIEFDKAVHDFGTINEGDKVETEFIVKNTGENDLVIADAKASCGCTVPEWPKEPIAPGASAAIKVSFDSSGKPGKQSKTVTLTTNTENGSETFDIKANVLPKAK